MDQEKRIDDLVRLLDEGAAGGVGHINVSCSADPPEEQQVQEMRSVQTLGCTDCSPVPLACSVPTLHEGLDRSEE